MRSDAQLTPDERMMAEVHIERFSDAEFCVMVLRECKRRWFFEPPQPQEKKAEKEQP